MMTGPGKGNMSQATELDCLGADAVAWHGNSDQGFKVKGNHIKSPCVVFVLYILYFLYSFSLLVHHVHAKLAVCAA